jgi:hypothetical protein
LTIRRNNKWQYTYVIEELVNDKKYRQLQEAEKPEFNQMD